MRIIKEATERKNEILDAAAALFSEKGFDQTSTNEILDAVGIAKGTLYHHFKSKEAIMDGVIERQSERMLCAARQVAQDHSIPVGERMLRVIMALKLTGTEGSGGRDMLEHLHKPQNALMHQKSRQIIIREVPPILAIVLKDGIEQGLFDTPYPLECMEMTVTYLHTLLDDGIIELTEQERMSRVQAFIFHLERLLGAERGSFASLVEGVL